MKCVAFLSLALVLLALYASHVQRAGFVYEDEKLVPHGTVPLTLAGRGLTRWTWGWARTPPAAHALSLVLHVVVVALALALAWQLSGSWLTAWATAGIAGLHPLQTQAIAYAAERDDLLAAVGVLLALLATASRRWWVLAPACALMAYMGKESALALALLVPLTLALQGRLREWMIWCGVLASWIGIVVLTDGRVTEGLWSFVNRGELISTGESIRWSISWSDWVLLQATAVFRLLVLAIAPWPGWLTPDPDIAIVPQAVHGITVVLIVGLMWAAWELRRSWPLVAFGLAFALAAVALRFVVQTPGSYVNGGHWYLSMVGLSLAAGSSLAGAKEQRRCL